jgi:hypothetical protein
MSPKIQESVVGKLRAGEFRTTLARQLQAPDLPKGREISL